MTLHWTICRDTGKDPLAEARAGSTDLGRFEHVRKVLDATFRGTSWAANVGTWVDRRIRVEFAVPVVPRPSSIAMRLDPAGDGAATQLLGGRFRTLAQKRLWAVFDAASQQRVSFPDARPRRSGALPPAPLTPASLDTVPHSTESWFVVYVQALPGEYLSDVLDFLGRLAQSIAAGRDLGLIEEFGVIRLPSGETLYGVGFKRAYAFIHDALIAYTGASRVIATLESGRLFVRPGERILTSTEVTCHTYWRSRRPT